MAASCSRIAMSVCSVDISITNQIKGVLTGDIINLKEPRSFLKQHNVFKVSKQLVA